MKIGYAGRDSLLSPIRSSPMTPNQSAAVHGRGHFRSTRSTVIIHMHLRIPRPFTTETVTDMSLVFSRLQPQNKRNGRNCLLRDPIDKKGAQNTTPKKDGGCCQPSNRRADPTVKDSLTVLTQTMVTTVSSLSLLLYGATSHSTVERHPSSGGLTRSSRGWMTAGHFCLMLMGNREARLCFLGFAHISFLLEPWLYERHALEILSR